MTNKPEKEKCYRQGIPCAMISGELCAACHRNKAIDQYESWLKENVPSKKEMYDLAKENDLFDSFRTGRVSIGEFTEELTEAINSLILDKLGVKG